MHERVDGQPLNVKVESVDRRVDIDLSLQLVEAGMVFPWTR